MQILSFIPLLVPLLSFLSVAEADGTINCDASNKCPQSLPCCSQYGTCGNGSFCLGGCDIRYSFNLTACMPMPIISKSNTTFDSNDDLLNQNTYLGNSTEGKWVYTGYTDVHDDNLIVQMPNGTTGSVLSSTEYMWYGKVSAMIKTSRTQGVITAFILFSDVQDEIDFEFVGADLTQAQTNYYSQGVLDYNNSLKIDTSDTYANWHLYEVDWTEDQIEWSIDSNVVRTLKKNDTLNSTTNEYAYPQTPARIQMSLWPGGAATNAIGTVEWAGGAVNWDADDIQKYGYFYSQIGWISVEPYDLPGGVKQIGCNGTSCNAFLFNSTQGEMQNITMVKKKTFLGNGGATGLDPQNEDEEVVKTVTKGSSTILQTSTKKATINTDTLEVPTGTTQAAVETTPKGYDPTMGFVQNSDPSSVASPGGSAGTSHNGVVPQYQVESMMGVMGAVGFGILSFFT